MGKQFKEDPKMDNAVRTNKIEVLANAATIVVSILLSVVLVKVFLLPMRSGPASSLELRVGMNLKAALPDVDWSKNCRTLLCAVSTQCHFCTASAPFFRRIIDSAGKDVRMV